jgi:hypothetical protein
MTGLQLFQDALDDMKRLKSIFPSSEGVQIIIAQLDRLVDLECGKTSDSSRLKQYDHRNSSWRIRRSQEDGGGSAALRRISPIGRGGAP